MTNANMKQRYFLIIYFIPQVSSDILRKKLACVYFQSVSQPHRVPLTSAFTVPEEEVKRSEWGN